MTVINRQVLEMLLYRRLGVLSRDRLINPFVKGLSKFYDYRCVHGNIKKIREKMTYKLNF